MPIPGCITGVACCAQCVGKPSYRTVTLSPAWLVLYGIYDMPVCRKRHCRTASPRGQTERENRCGQTEHAPAAYPRSHPTLSNQGNKALPACKRGLVKAELSQGFSTGKLKLHENAISVRRVTREGAGREFETGNRTGDTRKNLM